MAYNTNFFCTGSDLFPDISDLNETGRISVVGSDTEMKQGVQQQMYTRHQCITVMKEYKTSSLEELRCKENWT